MNFFLRPGNLVRHKSGGPIMMVDREVPSLDAIEPSVSCTWVEDRQHRFAFFKIGTLQTVHADGAPRDYNESKGGLTGRGG
jgi:uncharacterized protein YodC (DUF2158 family)